MHQTFASASGEKMGGIMLSFSKRQPEFAHVLCPTNQWDRMLDESPAPIRQNEGLCSNLHLAVPVSPIA